MSAQAVLYDVPGPRARRRQQIGTLLGSTLIAAVVAFVLWRLYTAGQFEARMWTPFIKGNILEAIFEGILGTLQAAVAAIILALLLASVLAVGRLSDRAVVRVPSVVAIEFFRAVPLVLLILFLFLGFADQLGRFGALVLALTLYNGSVLAEIFRAGLLAVPRGQSEAAYALGLRKSQVMRLVLIPQAVRIMLPAIVGQCVVALKDTALGFIIAYPELLTIGKRIYNFNYNILPTAVVVALIYIAMCYALSDLARRLEARQRRTQPPTAAQEGRPGLTDIDPLQQY